MARPAYEGIDRPTQTMRKLMREAIAAGGKVEIASPAPAQLMREAMIRQGWLSEDNSVTDEGKAVLERNFSGYVLPGNGPWKIEENCLAEAHNSTYAARGYRYINNKVKSGGIACTCPRALALIEIQREQSRTNANRHQTKLRNGIAVLPRWYEGPWKIEQHCPASGHNVLNRVTKPHDGRKCICPRAQALYEAYLARNVERMKARRAAAGMRPQTGDTKKREPIVIRSREAKEVRLWAAPDFSKGRCHTDLGAVARFDAALEAVSSTGPAQRARAAARAICNACPLQKQCLGYALQEEQPAGSWGGVMGGMDPWQRAAAKKREELRDGDSAASGGAAGVRGAQRSAAVNAGAGAQAGTARGSAPAAPREAVPGSGRAGFRSRAIRAAA